jgi:hypothetical protein
MFARLALLALAVLYAGATSASRQTHEVMICYAETGGYVCYAEDGNTEIYKRTKIQGLYADGWRLIAINTHSTSRVAQYFFERPVATEQ